MEPNSDEKTKIVYRNLGVEFLFCRRGPALDRKLATLQFFEQVKQGVYDIFISEVVFQEVAKASPEKRESLSPLLTEYQPEELDINEAVLNLASQYLVQGVLPAAARADSKHAVVATVYQLDALISWNLRHLANLNKMSKINAVNLAQGYTQKLELITSLEVLNHE